MDVSLKYKVKSDYLYKQRQIYFGNSEAGKEERHAIRSRNIRMCFGGSGIRVRVVKKTSEEKKDK